MTPIIVADTGLIPAAWRYREDVMRNMVLAVTAAAAIFSAGAFSNAKAADLYPEAPPPVAEIPPPAAAPPMAVVPRPPAVVLVEPRCPVVWQCGYWGCGWRQACGPVGAGVYYSAPYSGRPVSRLSSSVLGPPPALGLRASLVGTRSSHPV